MAFTPLAGKAGSVRWGSSSGTVLYFSEWNLSVEADIIPADTYEKTTSNSQYFKFGLVGLIVDQRLGVEIVDRADANGF